ncbi:MAG: hypothetical protein A3G75_07435, partial [Verrucomicrobia bacterium RIFCSPLOWO2_12_FULL_64_8]
IFLQTYGVTTSQCAKLVQKYAGDAKRIIQQEPYRVAREIDGIGFKTADKIAINLGFANDAPPRLDAGILYALQTLEEEGHTAYPAAALLEYTTELLQTTGERLAARLEALIAQHDLVSHSAAGKSEVRSPKSEATSAFSVQRSAFGVGGSALIQLPVNDRAEQRIAVAVARLRRTGSGLPPIKVDAAVKWAQERAGFQFHELQAAALRHALTSKLSILTGGPGTGKAQPLNALVLTPEGFRPIGKLRVGDEIVAAEGHTVRVTGVYPQGVKPTCRITFADGRSCECCPDHLWRVWTRKSVWNPALKRKVRARGWRVVPLQYIERRLRENRVESARMAVPLIEPSRSTANGNPPCDPYVLGALIGDGNLRDAVILTSRDPELTGRVATRVAPMGVRLKRVTLHGAATISWRLIARGKGFPNPVREAIKALGLNVNSEEKFVPEPYFAASLEERLELLRGLLDTDGTVDRLGVVSFTSCSFRLAKDFQRLAWSVGCIATIGATKKPSFIHRGERRRGRDAYTVFLQHPRPASLFALSRKQRRTQRLRPRRRLGYRLLIVSVTPLEPRECVCIAIDSPSGLYVTNDYVVTHNTTILHALVAILKAKKVRVHLAAPTGRAAQRLAETTGGFASTIHRLLKFDGAKGGFTVNENSPLATDFLIVDEASMLDTRLAAALFAAVPSRAHLLLVGDIDQLPSVGAGNVLKDLIACGDESRRSKVEGRKSEFADSHCAPEIPVTRLSMIYRQQNESHIVATAHAINAGEASPPPVVNEVGKASAWSDLNFIAAYSAEDCVAKVLELCSDYIPRHCRWLHPINDVQVLAPMHKGVAGVANLNRELQTALNPAHGDATPPSRAFRDHGVAAPRQPRTQVPALRTSSGEFRPGDKLIQLRNNYDQGLFNGDIGTVVSVNPGAGTLTADFDGEKHVLERGDFGDIAPAYAISIHKCVAADTWVLTTQGWQQIGDLWPARGSGVRVRAAAFQLAGPAGVVRADQVYRGTVEPAIRLITRHGFHLTGSHRHPVLVQCPTTAAPVWKKLPEVRPGDFVAIRRDMGLFPRQKVRIAYEPPAYPLRRRIALPATVNAEIALLLGYLVGDGAYAERKDGDVRLTNADRTLVRNYARILRKHFGLRPTLSRSTTHKTAPTWYVISKSFREWLAAAGLGFVTARVKSVPSAVLRSPR